MDDQKRIYLENQCKDTVGYAEAENKKSFMTGVSVALSKAGVFYEAKLKQQTRLVEIWKKEYENSIEDLRTLSKLIKKYSDED